MTEESNNPLTDKVSLNSSDLDLLRSINFRIGRVVMRKDDILYRQDDAALSFYLILEGAVELTRTSGFKGEDIKVFGENSFFGFSDLLKDNKRAAECVALKDTVLIEIFFRPDTRMPEKKFKEQKYPEFLNTSKIRKEAFKGPINEVIKEQNTGDTKIISILLQRCNFVQAPKFKTYIFNVIESGSKSLIVDLMHCRVIDSTFLGVLVASQREVLRQGGKLKLVCNKEIYSWLFLVTRMDKVFEIHTDLESALRNI